MSNIIKLNLNNNLVGGSNIEFDYLKNKIGLNGKFNEEPYNKARSEDSIGTFGTDWHEHGVTQYGDKFVEGVLPKMNVSGISIPGPGGAATADAGSLDRFWRPKIIDMDNALNETIELSLYNYNILDKAFTEQDGIIKLKPKLIPDIPEQPMELDGNTMIKLSDDDNITLEKLIQNMKVIQPVKLIDFMNKTNREISNIQSKLDPINEGQIQKIVEDLETVKGNIVNINKIVDYLYKRTE